jgi:hypothetical protein
MVDRSYSSALEEMLASIAHVLLRVRAQEDAEAELNTLRARLLGLLELVERDPGIEAACDDLYAVAKQIAFGADRGPRMSRLSNEASCVCGTGSVRLGRAKAQDMGSPDDDAKPSTLTLPLRF